MSFSRLVRRIISIALVLFAVLNIIAIFHAWKFTHFSKTAHGKIDVNHLTIGQKIKMAIFGVDVAKPVNSRRPSYPFESVKIQSNVLLDCWLLKHDSAKRSLVIDCWQANSDTAARAWVQDCWHADCAPREGTVIFFHGYIADKSTQLGRAEELYKMGYDVLLVDFMGSGNSEGYETTIGYMEAQEVKDAYNYLKAKSEKNIYLFGTSMGAAAVLKALHDYPAITPNGVILECPFGSMYQAVCARFRAMNAPAFPMAPLLVFWGGAINGFWAFNHNPAEYAKSVKCPVLLLSGGKDERVSKEEIDEIYNNLQGEKILKIYPNAGHESYLNSYREDWRKDIAGFIH